MDQINLILLPGLDGSGRLFEPLLEVLPPYLKPVVISYPVDTFLTYPELCEYVLERLPSDAPFFLVGESFAGPLALEIAASAPRGLVGVILCATFVSNPTRLPLSLGTMILSTPLFKIYPPSLIIRWLLVGMGASSSLVELVQDVFRSCNPYVMASRSRSVLNANAQDLLQECPAPILYLLATNDRVVRKGSFDEILAIRPDVICQTIDAPHFLFQREPERGAQAIELFVNSFSFHATALRSLPER